MSLHLRHVRLDELPAVRDLIAVSSRNAYQPATLDELPRVWAHLLRQRRLEMHVIEDASARPHERLLLVASGVFVQDDFGDELVKRYVPGVADRVMNAELAGASVILDREAAARANGNEGLIALGIDFAFRRPDWSTLVQMGPLIIDSLRGWVDGWHLRIALREAMGRDFYLVARGMGIFTFARSVSDAHGRKLAPNARRYLMGWSRAHVKSRPLALPSLFWFREREPLFHFSMAEQDLLVLVLRNHSDDECAELLGISPNTIKLRWRSIFERVANVKPDWFPQADRTEARRGVEKRRHLLAYLARHPEELRPRAQR